MEKIRRIIKSRKLNSEMVIALTPFITVFIFFYCYVLRFEPSVNHTIIMPFSIIFIVALLYFGFTIVTTWVSTEDAAKIALIVNENTNLIVKDKFKFVIVNTDDGSKISFTNFNYTISTDGKLVRLKYNWYTYLKNNRQI